ncbi:hypothetical protein Scep_021439 [Stephania cephalantha]|uniref:RNase H type-1 domain-containing protein n=1 Tax=Stephania cephalantha TaxID=152367 RepID=A0AAP0I1H4_9MAGN
MVNIGKTSIFGAELWGALQGLQLAWDMSFRQVVLELDNKSVVELLNGENISLNQHRHIVSLIRQLLQRRWFIRIVHIHREGNRAADWLASYAAHHAMGSHILEHCPSALSTILREDIIGYHFLDFVSCNQTFCLLLI